MFVMHKNEMQQLKQKRAKGKSKLKKRGIKLQFKEDSLTITCDNRQRIQNISKALSSQQIIYRISCISLMPFFRFIVIFLRPCYPPIVDNVCCCKYFLIAVPQHKFIN
jgi:hypothetical protein